MQPALAVLPELDPVRRQSEPGPVRRAWNRAPLEVRLHLRHAAGKVTGMRERAALDRCPRADLAAARARREVRVGGLGRHRSHISFDPHLHFEWLPVEDHRRDGALEKLAALAALEIRVEDEAAVIDPLEKNDANGRPAIAADGGERERRRLWQAVAADSRGGVEEPPESFDRVGRGCWHRAKCTRGHVERTADPD